MRRFHLIEEAFRDSCLKWGYREIKTPVLEYLHLFTSAGTLTPTMLSRVYSFLDWDGWSGERVVLRPDVTIPAARFYIETMEKKSLARLFYMANVFIFEETGEKTRERWQCGAELMGVGSPAADVELMTIALEVLNRAGLKGIELRLSHAGVVRGLLQKLGLSPEEQIRVFDQLLDGEMEALYRIKTEKPGLVKILAPLLNLKKQPSEFVSNLQSLVLSDLPEIKPQIDDFISITGLLQSLGCPCRIDLASLRGFEYYTGVIFQLFAGGKKIGGGGRYDNLIPLMGGEDTPASGFALYLDRLMYLIQTDTVAEPATQSVLVRPESDKSDVVKESFEVANRLRQAGYIAELYLGSQKPADFRWLLDIRGKAPRFTLTEQHTKERLKVQDADEVLALLKYWNL